MLACLCTSKQHAHGSQRVCVLQIVNNGGFRQLANVTLTGVPGYVLNSSAKAEILTGDFAEIENTINYPKNVSVLLWQRPVSACNGLPDHMALVGFQAPEISLSC